jgi:hypothetical protein
MRTKKRRASMNLIGQEHRAVGFRQEKKGKHSDKSTENHHNPINPLPPQMTIGDAEKK